MSNPTNGTKRPAEDSADHAASDAGTSVDGSDSKLDGQSAFASDMPAGPGENETGREERLRKNREKARDRRNRKKALIDDMQRNVVVLSKMNSDLKKKNADLLVQLAQYGAAGQTGDIQPVDTATTDAALTATGAGLPGIDGNASNAPMPPLPNGTLPGNNNNTVAAMNQQQINEQAQALSRLNPSVLVGNPALLQLLRQQILVQNQQSQPQQPQMPVHQPQQVVQAGASSSTPNQMARPNITSSAHMPMAQQTQDLQAKIMALQRLQAMQQQQQPQQQAGGIPQLINTRNIGGLSVANTNLSGGMANMGNTATGMAAVGAAAGGLTQTSQNASNDPNRPLHIVVHHHHTNDGGGSSGNAAPIATNDQINLVADGGDGA